MSSEQNNDNQLNNKRQHFVFSLFIAGMSVKSINAIENLRFICENYIAGQFEIEIVDIHQQEQLTSQHGIIATPTLIKTEPLPRRIILGDLSDTQKVLKLLDITTTK